MRLHDAHAHILFGVDDGASDLDESLEMLAGLEALGYETATATPHWRNPLFPSRDREAFEGALGEIRAARGDRAPRVLPGAEIYFDENLIALLESGAAPALGGGRVYLVEFGYHPGAVPRGFEEAVFRLGAKEIFVAIAHPERCRDLARDPARLDAVRRGGGLAQVDLMSLVGHYGRDASRAAWAMLERGAADLVSSDLHHPRDLPTLAEALDELARWDAKELVRLASDNPRRVLEGRPWEVERRE